jgi:predicted  nucleic acid-binding Zn-ribbon protein
MNQSASLLLQHIEMLSKTQAKQFDELQMLLNHFTRVLQVFERKIQHLQKLEADMTRFETSLQQLTEQLKGLSAAL